MTIVNGYEISKVEFSSQYGCIKIGQLRGKMFKSKAAAIAYAKAN